MTVPNRIMQMATAESRSGPVFDVKFAPDGSFIVTTAMNGPITRWRIPSLERLDTLEVASGSLYRLAVSPDSHTIAVAGENGVTLWTPSDGNDPIELTTQMTTCARFSPLGDVLIMGLPGRISVYNLSSRAFRRAVPLSSPAATSIVYSPDGSMLAASTITGEVLLIDASTWMIKRNWPLKPTGSGVVYSCAFSSDGNILAASLTVNQHGPIGSTQHPDLYEIVLLDTGSLDEPDFRSTLVGHTGWIGSLDTQPGGNLLASGGFDERVRLWDLNTRLLLGESGELGGPVGQVAFSPGGQLLASGTLDGFLQLWDMTKVDDLSPARRVSSAGAGSVAALLDLFAKRTEVERHLDVLVAERLADRLTEMNYGEEIQLAVAEVGYTFRDRLDRLMIALSQVFNVRRERALREGDQREAAFYNRLLHYAMQGGYTVKNNALSPITGRQDTTGGTPAYGVPSTVGQANERAIGAIIFYAREGGSAPAELIELELSSVDTSEISDGLDNVIDAVLHGNPEYPHAVEALQFWYELAVRGEPVVAKLTAWYISGGYERTGQLDEATLWCKRALSLTAEYEIPETADIMDTMLSASLVRLLRKRGDTTQADSMASELRSSIDALDMSLPARREILATMDQAYERGSAARDTSAHAPEEGEPEPTEASSALITAAREVAAGSRDLDEEFNIVISHEPTTVDLYLAYRGLVPEIKQATSGKSDPIQMAKVLLFLCRIAIRYGSALITSAISGDIGALMGVAGKNEEAIRWITRALELAREDGSPEYLSGLHGNLGNAYRNVDQFRKALESYSIALRLAEDNALKELEVRHRVNRAIVYSDLGDIEDEISELRDARTSARLYGLDDQIGMIANNLASAYNSAGAPESAERLSTEAFEAAIRQGDETLACKALCNRGQVRVERGDVEEGMQDLERAHAMAERIGLPSVSASYLTESGTRLWERGDLAGARDAFEKAVVLGRGSGYRSHTAALLTLGDFEASTNSRESAAPFWEEAVRVGERARLEVENAGEGIGLKRKLAEAYGRLIGASLAADDLNTAFTLLARSAGDVRAPGRESAPDNLDVNALSDILLSISPDAVMATGIYVDTSLKLFVLRAGSPNVALLETGLTPDDVNRMKQAFEREVSSAPRYGFPRETWAEIGQPIFEQLRPYLHSGSILFFVPTGALHGINIHALGSSAERMLDLCAISYLPSIRALKDLRVTASASAPRSTLVVGAHFVEEGNAVSRILNSSDCITGNHVNRNTVLRQLFTADVVHISTHGFFDSDDSRLSGLVLEWTEELARYLEAKAIPAWARNIQENAIVRAQRPSREVLLTAADFDQPMAAGLVCLSACESGLVQTDPANDAAGLVPTLLGAGVPIVVATLWRVDSHASLKLVTTFYEQLVASGWRTMPQEAIRLAALKVREEMAAPYYWAPFVSIGGVFTSEVRVT